MTLSVPQNIKHRMQEYKDIKRNGSGLLCTFREVLWKAIKKNSAKKGRSPGRNVKSEQSEHEAVGLMIT